MKRNNKLVTMDYRNGTTKQCGIFADPNWPRDDETIESDFNRLDRRVKYSRDKSIGDSDQHREMLIPTNFQTPSDGKRLK